MKNTTAHLQAQETKLCGATAPEEIVAARSTTPTSALPQATASVTLRSNKTGEAILSGTIQDILVDQKIQLVITDSEGNRVITSATPYKNAFSVKADIKSLVDGPLNVNTVVTDRNGDEVIGSSSYKKDLIKSQLTVSLSDLSDQSKAVITGTTQDVPAGDEVLIEIKGPGNVIIKALATVGPDGRYATTADLTDMVDGRLMVTASAIDRNSHKLKASAKTELNAQESELSVNSQYVGKTKVEFSGVATDVPVGSYVHLKISNSAGEERKISVRVKPDGTYNVTKELKSFADGPLKVEAISKDRNGNVLAADNDPVEPSLSVKFDNLNRETISQTVLRGETAGVKPNETVVLTATDEAGNIIQASTAVRSDGSFVKDLDLKGFVDGKITFEAYAKDKKGNFIKSTTEVELDAIAGDLRAGFNNPDVETLRHVLIRGASTDIAPGESVVLTVTDQEGNSVSVTTMVGTDGTFTEAADLHSLLDGDLTLTATSTDRNGNILTTVARGELDVLDGTITVNMKPLADVEKAEISGRAVDISPGTDVNLVVKDLFGKEIKIVAKVAADGTYSTTGDISSLEKGPLSVQASATDRNGGFVSAFHAETPSDPTGPALQPEALKLTAEAGRVVTIELAGADKGSIADIKILSQGAHGQVSVNPDNTLSLVLSENPDKTTALDFAYEITYTDGRTQQAEAEIKVTPPTQKGGWGEGNFYMLEEAADGHVVVEHGDNHRKIHVTESSDGLTRAEIAKAEGLAASKITAKWLADHPEYGATPDKALSTELGMELWNSLKGTSSNWLLFERGYEYADTGRLIGRGVQGESELHPVYVGAYGEGDAPQILDKPNLYQFKSQHVVIQDVGFQGGFQVLTAANVLMNNVEITGRGLNIQNIDGFTLRNSSIIDVVKDDPNNTGPKWHPSLNRDTGIFVKNSEGVLIEDTFADRNGWAEGYDYNLSSKKPMPPSMFSHNFYIQNDNLDVTFRDNIVMRAASFGAQIRSGGVIEDNVFLDSNGAVTFLGGNYKSAGQIGNFSLFMDNIITSAAHKRVAEKEGALSQGIVGGGENSSLIGNIIAHLADPNNPKEFAEKKIAHSAHNVSKAFYDDTIVFNWFSSERGNGRNTDMNVDGLDNGTLNATTIQKFAADLLGRDTATISDLANYLRAQASGQLNHVVDADLIVAFFQEGFGMEVAARTLETTARFTPNELGDGIRWDNRLNWSTGEVPEGEATNIDLGGNSVYFGAKTVAVDDFIFGDFGKFTASSGRLNIEGQIDVGDTGARLTIERAGQVWVDGYQDSDRLTVEISGGRFANTGEVTGRTEISVSNKGQLLLAVGEARFDLTNGSTLRVEGAQAKVGIDGLKGDVGLIRLQDGSRVEMIADATGFSKISEFRSGALHADKSAAASSIRLGGDLDIDVTALAAINKNGTYRLFEADELMFDFKSINIDGLDHDTDAIVQIDYERDIIEVILKNGMEHTSIEHVGHSGIEMKDQAIANIFGEYMAY